MTDVSAGRRHLDPSTGRNGPRAVAAIVALALVVRLPGMFGWWVNPDEGTYFAVLTQESFRVSLAEAFATAHPPLYFLLLRGMAVISDELVWLRSLALVSGCASVYVFVLLGREVAGEGASGWIAGLTAGLVLALSPGAVALSQVIRPYMLLVLLIGLALYTLLRYLRAPSARGLAAYATLSGLAALLHYSAALVFGVFVALVVADGIARGTRRTEWRRLAVVQAVPGAIVAALYALQLRTLMRSATAEFAMTTWLSGYLIDTPMDAWLNAIGFHTALVGRTAGVAATLVTLLAVIVAVRRRALVVSVMLGGALLISVACAALELYPFGAGRHSAWLMPFVAVGSAWVLAQLATRGGANRGLSATLAVAMAAGLLLRAPLGGDLPEPAAPEQILRTEHVAAMAGPLDPQSPPRLVVMSLETYRLLVPLFRRERQAARLSPDGFFAHFRWGIRDVIVLPGLDVAARADQIDQPNHLHAATLRAAQGFGVPLPAPGEPVLILSGGWHVQGVFDLGALSSRHGLAGSTESVPGLIAVTLDLDAYGRALAAGSGDR